MKEAIKKIDKKFIIFIISLIMIPVFLVIILMIIRGCSSTKMSYSKYQDKMISSAKKYFKETDTIPTKESEYSIVNLDTLVSDGYIKSSSKVLDDDCEGYVTVRRNGVDLENKVEGFLNYNVNLECNNYKTNNLKNLVMEDLTTVESGVYSENGNYIFKGRQVDNYIKIFNTNYRIVSIDANGLAKLVKAEAETQHLYWDNKYNTEIKSSVGKNIYKDSFILEKLNEIYNTGKKTKDNLKQIMVAHDVCIDKKNINDNNINNYNCSEVLQNQKYSLLNIYDFARASLDPECVNLSSKSCKNYNYMGSMGLYTWTPNAVSDNTYQVYYIENGNLGYDNASTYYSYNLVIYIDSNEIVSSGKGTKEMPYIIDK